MTIKPEQLNMFNLNSLSKKLFTQLTNIPIPEPVEEPDDTNSFMCDARR